MIRFNRSVLKHHRSADNFKFTRLGVRSLSTESLFTIPHIIQTAIIGLQSTTGAPWWATIAVSTIFARLSLVPLVRTQVIASQKLGVAMPELRFLNQLLQRRMKRIPLSNSEERMRILSVFFQGVNACFKIHDVSKIHVIAYPLLNMTLFMTFVFSVRDLILHTNNYELMEGGMLWFVELAEKDPTLVLPFTALSLSYLALELGFGRVKDLQWASYLKDGCQSLVVLSVPFVVTLPAGVFCYWIPSSLFAIAQSLVLKSPYAQSMLGIPAPKMPGGGGGGGGTAEARAVAAGGRPGATQPPQDNQKES